MNVERYKKTKARKRHLDVVQLTALHREMFSVNVKGIIAKTILTGEIVQSVSAHGENNLQQSKKNTVGRSTRPANVSSSSSCSCGCSSRDINHTVPDPHSTPN